MAVTLTLTDTEGRFWDFSPGNPVGTTFVSQSGQVIINGSADAYDGGLALAVNGRLYDTNISSLGVNGRELNLAPVIMNSGTVAVTRSFLVSDAAISAVGFIRILDSFTNITNVSQTITVEFVTDVGSDSATAVVADTTGNNAITISDFGYVTDEGTNQTGGDSSVGFAYGDGRGLAPVAAGQALLAGSSSDEIVVRYSITLAPGETRSLLSFGFQNTTTAQGAADLPLFTRSLQALDADNFLAGISAAERATIVNYAEGLRGRPDFVLTDGGGTQWGIDVGSRTLATVGSSALREASFGNSSFGPAFGNLASSSLGEEGREVSYRYTPSVAGLGTSSVDYSYFAAPDRNWVRQLVTFNGAPGIVFNTPADGLLVQTGGSLVSDIAQASLIGNGAVALDDRAWIFDDSASGADGTSPPLGVVVGNFQFSTGIALGVNDRATFSSGQLEVERQQILSGTQSFLFFFASNGTAGSTFGSTTPLLTPGFRELAGLSDAEVASIRNFTLTAADRLDERVGTTGNDEFVGNYWGDQFDGLGGDDIISGGGSDDVLSGGAGDDRLAGGIGNDRLNGGSENDLLSGGEGNDILDGGTGNDTLNGDAGADAMTGGSGNDLFFIDNAGDTVTELAGGGIDTINSAISFTLGNTTVGVGNFVENLTLLTGANDGAGNALDNVILGNIGANTLAGFGGNDTLDGGAGADTLIGGIGNDSYFVDNIGDLVRELSGEGTDTVFSTIDYTLGNTTVGVNNFVDNLTLLTGASNGTGNALDNVLVGNAANNTLSGLGGNDTIAPNAGANIVDGGAGTDTLVLAGWRPDYQLFTISGQNYLFGRGDSVRVTDIETVAFGNGAASATTLFTSAQAFDPLRYIAGYSDLRAVFGTNTSQALNHFLTDGFGEGRNPGAFDALRYIAGSSDLRAVFGTDTVRATQHFIQFGAAEGRNPDAFDALRYIASSSDLIAAFGANASAGARHYIEAGASEGRNTTAFDPVRYLAGYGDLRAAFGTDTVRATQHYILFGYAEGRSAGLGGAAPAVADVVADPTHAGPASIGGGIESAFASLFEAEQDTMVDWLPDTLIASLPTNDLGAAVITLG